jgi:hypothetical protein
MCNHKVIKLLLVTLLISYKTWAAQIFDFETLSNPSYQMSATLRIENLLLLSQSEPNNAGKCLNEIFLITRGKYGFSKRSATLDERKTVVSALFAYRQLMGEGSLNPFSVGAIGEVSKDMSQNVANHLMVLKQGYEKIAALNDSIVTEFEVFGVTLKVADLFVQPKVILLDADEFDQHSHHSEGQSDSRDEPDSTEPPQLPVSDGERANSPVFLGGGSDNSSHSQKGDGAGACESPPQVQETQEDVLIGCGDFDGKAGSHLSSARSSPVGDGEGSSPVHEVGSSSGGDEGDGEPPKFDEEEEQPEGDDNADGSEEDGLNPEMTSESDGGDSQGAESRPYTPADDAGKKPCCQRNKEDRGCVIS